jgi:hypothetical protein
MKNWQDDEELCYTAQKLLRCSEVPEHLYTKFGKLLYDEDNMFEILRRQIDYPTIKKLSKGRISEKDWYTFKEVWINLWS